MAYDLEAIKQFGHNYVRLHQKVNPDRWYYHADRLGIAVAQDVVQHYGDSVQVRPTDFSARQRSCFFVSAVLTLFILSHPRRCCHDMSRCS